MAAKTDVRESWFEVENEGIQTVRSTEEIAELLADAVTERRAGGEGIAAMAADLKDQSMTSSDEHEEEQPLVFNVPSQPTEFTSSHVQEEEHHYCHHSAAGAKTGFMTGIINCLKDFIKSLSNPAIVASHLAMFGLGMFIGRRLVS